VRWRNRASPLLSRLCVDCVDACIAVSCVSAQNSCWLQETPLYRAAFYGHVDVVRALIAAGADVNAKTVCDVLC